MAIENDSIDRIRHAPRVIAASFVLGSMAYSMHAASFLHPKVAVFSIGAFLLAALACFAHDRRAWVGFAAFLPLWAYVIFGGARAIAGLPPTVYHTGEAVLMLVPSLLFVSLARPYLSYDFVRGVLLLGSVPVAAMALAQYAGWITWLLPEVPGYTQVMYSVFGNQDLLGGFVAIGVVAAVQGALRKGANPAWPVATLAVLLPAWLLAGSRTAWLAGVAGLCVSLLCMEAPPRKRLAWLGIAGLVTAVLLVALSPTATLERVTGTFGADDEGGWLRLWFWDGTLRMAASAPVFGVGLGAFVLESPRFLGEALMHSDWIAHRTTELTVFHAHSDPLEAFAEMGLLGAALLGWMAWRLREGRGEAWGPLVVLLVFCCFNATVISPPHAVAGLMLMSCLMPVPRGHQREGGRLDGDQRRLDLWGHLSVLVVAGGFVIAVHGLLLYPSIQLRMAQTAHLDGAGSAEGYLRVRAYTVAFPEARASLAQWHVEREDWESAITAYEEALPHMDTGRIHLELGALHYRMGNDARAREYLENAVLRWPWNYDAWRLLIATLPDDEHAAAMARARAFVSPDDAARLEALFTPQ